MNFKQRNLYVLLDGPMGEYPLKRCFCLFNRKTFAMLLIVFTHYACVKKISTKFKCESSGNYCEFVKLNTGVRCD